MRKAGLILLCHLVIYGVVFLCGEGIIEEIVAIVNDDIITLSQYKAQNDALYKMLRSRFQGEEFEKQYQFRRQTLLNTMVTDLLIMQEARKSNYNVTEQVRMAIDNIKKENNLASDEELIRALQREGLDFEKWKKQMEEDFLKQNVIVSEVDRNIAIDDSEIVNYYKLHPDEFTEPIEYKLKAIYLSSEGKSEEDVEAKKREINEKIAAEEKLADLASQYSEGPEKETQGDLGSFKEGELEKGLEESVNKLEVGELTPWLNMRNGWYLLKLEEKKESHLKPFEDARKEIEEKIFLGERQKKLDEFLKDLRKRSYIKILKTDPLD